MDMQDQVNPNLARGNAYRVFVEEMKKHLVTIERIASGEHLSIDELYKASATFHTIKGGAGFFGLRSMATVAGELEILLISPGFDWELHGDVAVSLVTELRKFAEDLPSPAA